MYTNFLGLTLFLGISWIYSDWVKAPPPPEYLSVTTNESVRPHSFLPYVDFSRRISVSLSLWNLINTLCMEILTRKYKQSVSPLKIAKDRLWESAQETTSHCTVMIDIIQFGKFYVWFLAVLNHSHVGAGNYQLLNENILTFISYFLS